MLGANIHRWLVFVGLLTMVVGMPISNPVMSIGQFALAANWLLEGKYSIKLKSLFRNKLALVLISLFLLHVIGLLWTSELEWGMKDLRIKLPLFLMPFLVFTSEKITPKQFRWLLAAFVISVTVASLASLGVYLGFTEENILDKRKMTFIPHIRFALMVVLAMAIVGYYLIMDRKKSTSSTKVFLVAILSWLFYFQVLLESASGYAALAVLLIYLVIRGIYFLPGKMKATLVALAIVSAISTTVYLKSVIDQHYFEIPFNKNELDIYTPSGRIYFHETGTPFCENGHRVYNYLRMDEIEAEWNKVSSVDFNGNDARGNLLWATLIRYMTAQGLRKDSLDFQKLKPNDIALIEIGVANPRLHKMWGVANRFDGFLWEYDKYAVSGDPTGSSLIQRMFYLQVGWQIFTENWLFGVGTGDTRMAFANTYENRHTILPKKYRARAHNQFLTMFLTFGIIGGFWFLFVLIYPMATPQTGLLYTMFVVILSVSMLADNTLETQAGVTLFAFFNTFLLWRHGAIKTIA